MNAKRSAKQPAGASREAEIRRNRPRLGQHTGLVALMVLAVWAVSAQPLMTPPAQRKSAERMKTAGAYPFRFDGTNIINLHPVINYYSNVDTYGAPRMTNRPSPEWEFIQGHIEEPFGGGLLVQRHDPLDWQLQGDSHRIHLT